MSSSVLAAVGTHSLSSATPAAAATAPRSAAPLGKTTSLDHISFAVTDYGRSRDFYADLMGWEVLMDDGERQARLAIGDVGDIIIRNNR